MGPLSPRAATTGPCDSGGPGREPGSFELLGRSPEDPPLVRLIVILAQFQSRPLLLAAVRDVDGLAAPPRQDLVGPVVLLVEPPVLGLGVTPFALDQDGTVLLRRILDVEYLSGIGIHDPVPPAPGIHRLDFPFLGA